MKVSVKFTTKWRLYSSYRHCNGTRDYFTAEALRTAIVILDNLLMKSFSNQLIILSS